MAKNTIAKIQDDPNRPSVVQYHFSNGTVKELDAELLTGDVRAATLRYGVKERMRDAYAGAESVDIAIGALEARWSAMLDGVWSERVPGEVAADSVLAECIIRFKRAEGKEISPETANQFVSGLSKEAKKTLRAGKEIAAIAAQLAAERAAAKPSVAGLLAAV